MPKFRLQTAFLVILLCATCFTAWENHKGRLREKEALAEFEYQKGMLEFQKESTERALRRAQNQIGGLYTLAKDHGYWEEARDVVEKYSSLY